MSEFIRYCLAGGIAFLADFITFLTLADVLGVNYLIANTLGFSVGIVTSYFISISWVFSNRKYTQTTPEFFLFGVIGIGGLILGNSCMWYLVESVRIGHIQAKYIVTFLVLLFNYSMRKHFLFRSPTVIEK
jgi:putative flippase GtrA